MLANQQVHSFRVRVNNRGKNGNLMIGFSPQPNHDAGVANYHRCGWYLDVYNGSLHSQQGDAGRSYATAIPNGSIVTASLDPQACSISFSVDGCNLLTAFSNIPAAATLYPALDLSEVGQVVELV